MSSTLYFLAGLQHACSRDFQIAWNVFRFAPPLMQSAILHTPWDLIVRQSSTEHQARVLQSLEQAKSKPQKSLMKSVRLHVSKDLLHGYNIHDFKCDPILKERSLTLTCAVQDCWIFATTTC